MSKKLVHPEFIITGSGYNLPGSHFVKNNIRTSTVCRAYFKNKSIIFFVKLIFCLTLILLFINLIVSCSGLSSILITACTHKSRSMACTKAGLHHLLHEKRTINYSWQLRPRGHDYHYDDYTLCHSTTFINAFLFASI